MRSLLLSLRSSGDREDRDAESFGDNIFSRGVNFFFFGDVGVLSMIFLVVVVVPFFMSRRYCERTVPIILAVSALHISYSMNSSCSKLAGVRIENRR